MFAISIYWFIEGFYFFRFLENSLISLQYLKEKTAWGPKTVYLIYTKFPDTVLTQMSNRTRTSFNTALSQGQLTAKISTFTFFVSPENENTKVRHTNGNFSQNVFFDFSVLKVPKNTLRIYQLFKQSHNILQEGKKVIFQLSFHQMFSSRQIWYSNKTLNF